jgi:hypothetical protein
MTSATRPSPVIGDFSPKQPLAGCTNSKAAAGLVSQTVSGRSPLKTQFLLVTGGFAVIPATHIRFVKDKSSAKRRHSR